MKLFFLKLLKKFEIFFLNEFYILIFVVSHKLKELDSVILFLVNKITFNVYYYLNNEF